MDPNALRNRVSEAVDQFIDKVVWFGSGTSSQKRPKQETVKAIAERMINVCA